MLILNTTQHQVTTGRFYSPRQIGVASLLGSPLAAAWFISRDYSVLADERREIRYLWFGLAATIFVLAVALALPQKTPNVLWPLIYSMVIEQWAKSQFDGPYKRHIGDGGSQGSWWVVIGVGVLALFAIIGMAFAMFYLFPSILK